jgi:hypothetical protein
MTILAGTDKKMEKRNSTTDQPTNLAKNPSFGSSANANPSPTITPKKSEPAPIPSKEPVVAPVRSDLQKGWKSASPSSKIDKPKETDPIQTPFSPVSKSEFLKTQYFAPKISADASSRVIPSIYSSILELGDSKPKDEEKNEEKNKLISLYTASPYASTEEKLPPFTKQVEEYYMKSPVVVDNATLSNNNSSIANPNTEDRYESSKMLEDQYDQPLLQTAEEKLSPKNNSTNLESFLMNFQRQKDEERELIRTSFSSVAENASSTVYPNWNEEFQKLLSLKDPKTKWKKIRNLGTCQVY